MRTWTLDLPDQPYITANSRAHWSKRSACAAGWRDATALLARQAKVPELGRVYVTLTMVAKDRRRRDADNLVSGVLKHCLDGLVDAGVIPDDTPEHVDGSLPRIVHQGPRPAHRWLLDIRPLEATDG